MSHKNPLINHLQAYVLLSMASMLLLTIGWVFLRSIENNVWYNIHLVAGFVLFVLLIQWVTLKQAKMKSIMGWIALSISIVLSMITSLFIIPLIFILIKGSVSILDATDQLQGMSFVILLLLQLSLIIQFIRSYRKSLHNV
ncbi:hypothetical protein [Nonlabens xiamenensis]|uniref:hypothetical protein n=1 Tax=Nonlabens xiamenensis TaxID=2341043 RepID=UPI0013DD8B17|nr:hypothetical protein [Nonlabens xiamenensis]